MLLICPFIKICLFIINTLFISIPFSQKVISSFILMSLHRQCIFLQKYQNFKLMDTKISDFLIFSTNKTSYQNQSINSVKNNFQTFLLIKAVAGYQPQKKIALIQSTFQSQATQEKKSIQNKRQKTYCSSFLRHVDLHYCRKLAQMLELLTFKPQNQIQNEWLILYEVQNYQPNIKKLSKLYLDSPIYGGRVEIINPILKDRMTKRDNNYFFYNYLAKVSNLFRFKSQNFYFLSDLLDQREVSNLSLISSEDFTTVYGLTYKIKENIVCIPFYSILFQKSCQIHIQDSLLNKLYKTCYVEFIGSYCTGIFVQQNKIITTRHLLPASHQKLGTQVLLKKFPYNQNFYGKVVKIGLAHLDFIQIQIQQQLSHLKSLKQEDFKQNILVKEVLINNTIKTENYSERSQMEYEKLLNIKHMGKYIKQNELQKYLVGDQILAIGFGKFSFNIYIFDRFQFILPTIATGIVSKLIQIKGMKVFLKTDAKLYSGFSGSGIWMENMVGMAVFILKNKNTNSHYNRQNFSYTREFLNELIKKKDHGLQGISNKEFEEFDKIQTRQCLRIQSHKAKL